MRQLFCLINSEFGLFALFFHFNRKNVTRIVFLHSYTIKTYILYRINQLSTSVGLCLQPESHFCSCWGNHKRIAEQEDKARRAEASCHFKCNICRTSKQDIMFDHYILYGTHFFHFFITQNSEQRLSHVFADPNGSHELVVEARA